MKLNKKTLFQIHSWIGIKLSILFFIVCFSGTLATLSNEMDWLFYPGIRASGSGERVSYNKMVDEVQKTYPNGSITYWVMPKEPYLNDIVYVNKDGQRHYVFVDPYSGQVKGTTTVTFQRFFRDFHYYLFMPFYQIGYFMVLVFAFLLAISLTTALIFYKKWWRKLFELKSSNGKLVLFRSLHRLVGLWAIPFLLVFSLTGIWYFVERTNLGGVSDTSNPVAPTLENEKSGIAETVPLSYHLDYDKAAQMAQEAIPGLQIKGIVPTNQASNPVYIRGTSHVPLVRNRANRVYLDPLSYQPVMVQKAEEIPLVMYFNDIADPIHFGNWGGLATKITWFFGGLALSGLVLSGIWIALKRQVKKMAANQIAPLGAWKYINWLLVLAIIGFMYYFMIFRYSLSWGPLVLVGTILGLTVCLTWYVFVYKLQQAPKG
ncbi:PepSY-associated TM helix domain-containing protein [Cyclobacterium jeungdonense]|uniref:PepSY-associated TM helix domain-containing protein n=1 Tax=Cyclobacterium jeungdonense TaxID=708087 RepID=A0ABT8C9Q2_9BACT|nr:PepSY-associated TM helix domain-containing protein [Cyclobacterium jeungdonense]MDN3689528.1 PepSY-associated TM helix domain-containing protein [Cyclobacterium jeungdonense]